MVDNLADDLARQIKERRDELHLSQAEAAQMLGVSQRTLQAWEAGKAMPWPRHRRALGIFLASRRSAA